MKILFIAAKLHTIEPFGILSLVPYLKRDGHQVALQEAEAPDVLARALEFRPQIIAYSVCTGSQEYYLAFNRALKCHLDFIAVFGGPHPTFFPEIIHEPGVDAICRGEGELAFAEFCQSLESTGSPEAVPNFSVKRAGAVRSLPPRPLVRDADSFLTPDETGRLGLEPASHHYGNLNEDDQMHYLDSLRPVPRIALRLHRPPAEHRVRSKRQH